MNELTVVRTPEAIANEINFIKDQTRTIVLQSSIEIGRRLTEAKELVPHGEWGAWLQTNVEYSQSTAQNLMAIYREYGSNPQTLGNLSYTKAVALLGVPAEEREAFTEEHDVEHLSSREVQRLVKEKEEADKARAEAENRAQIEQQRAEESEQRLQMMEEENRKHQQKIEQLTKDIKQASASGDKAKVHELKQQLTESQAAVKKLEAALSEKPVETSAVIEKIPDDVQTELNNLRKQVTLLRSNEAAKFHVSFDNLVQSFNGTLSSLQAVESVDGEAYEKFRAAFRTLLDRMGEKL